MILTAILWGLAAATVAAAIIITVGYLSTAVVRSRIKSEIPEADYVTIQKIKDKGEVVIGPVYKVKAYKRNGDHINDATFNCTSSEYFYNNEKISIY